MGKKKVLETTWYVYSQPNSVISSKASIYSEKREVICSDGGVRNLYVVSKILLIESFVEIENQNQPLNFSVYKKEGDGPVESYDFHSYYKRLKHQAMGGVKVI